MTYPNAHFTILGRVIEVVTGMGWREYLAKNVFAPLAMMRTTGFISEMHGDANKAVPLRFGRGGVQVAEMMKRASEPRVPEDLTDDLFNTSQQPGPRMSNPVHLFLSVDP